MHYIHYHGQITHQGMRNLEILLLTAKEEGNNDVTICICSKGGDVSAGIGLYNYIQMLPITVHIHCTGLCESIAATILLAGVSRSSVPVASFMTHAAVFSDGPMKGQISNDTHLISQPFKDKLNWSNEDVEKRFGRDNFSISPHEAMALGMIDEIKVITVTDNDTLINVNIPPE